MDCGTALAKLPRLNPYGKASGRVFASEPGRGGEKNFGAYSVGC